MAAIWVGELEVHRGHSRCVGSDGGAIAAIVQGGWSVEMNFHTIGGKVLREFTRPLRMFLAARKFFRSYVRFSLLYLYSLTPLQRIWKTRFPL